MKPVLSLADLELFDPHAPVGQSRGERRFACPLCGADKPRDAAHRCFCLNSCNGLYNCKRCNSKGRLQEFWPEKSSVNRQEIEVQNLRRAFDIVSPPLPAETKTDWCVLWESARPLDESPENALSYLQHRAISLEVAVKNGVSFIASWHGRGTLCFPFKDQNGEVVAIAGRALRNGGMDKPASGPKKLGAFWASALGFGALDAALPAIIVCEAPFDALSLAQAGFPALAIGGTSPPVWLPSKCAFRRVLLAFDADDAGDNAASKIGAMLASFGATGARLRPQGAKDWNEWLQKDGVEAIQNAVDPFVCD